MGYNIKIKWDKNKFGMVIKDETRWYRIRNEQLKKIVWVKVQKARLGRFGYVKRMEVDRISRLIQGGKDTEEGHKEGVWQE